MCLLSPPEQPRPRRIGEMSLPHTIFTLAVGAIGGGLFYLLQMPLPWMLGALTASALGALLGLPTLSVRPIREPSVVVIGLTLGMSFTVSVFDDKSWIMLIGLLAAIVLMGTSGTLYLRRVAGLDTRTAYFAAMPGGVYEMTSQGEVAGGDARAIVLIQSIRVVLTVMTIPIAFRILFDVGTAPSDIRVPSPTTLGDYAGLVGCGVVGWALAQQVGLPNAPLLGSAILAAVAHATGVLNAAPHGPLLATAQVVVGTSLGGQFIGTNAGRLRQIGMHAFGVMGLNMVILGLVASILAGLTSRSVSSLVLMLAPGGMTEMSLLAFGIGVDVAFVSFHQFIRILLVQLVAPSIFRWRR